MVDSKHIFNLAYSNETREQALSDMEQNIFLIGIFNVIICAAFGYAFGPLIKNLGLKFNILDIPDSRKIHKLPIVRIGGLTIFITFLLFIFTIPLFFNLQNIDIYESQNTFILLIGGISFFLLGLHDDIYKSPPVFRLIVQILVAIALTFHGINISNISIKLPYLESLNINLPIFFVYLFTSLWIVGLTNAINWLDGFDGLAGGFCSIVSIGLAIHFYTVDILDGSIFFSILAGSTIGFLLRNFRPPLYIMGDCGSYFLGYCLSVGTLFYSTNYSDNSISIIYLITLFSLPILDMCFVIFKRIINRINPFKADSNHIHHRLLNNNVQYKYIIFSTYSYTTFSTFLALLFF